ncbi:hypothetical protein DVH24_021603 [Malus domestica]|uniref:Uncharacterized protein n=1 Tax=Malus domestica TaxID=3750 RepID=A0A498K3G2_MALDO|nr:hypothetical protein DVH24_021603 [Malus domestica]
MGLARIKGFARSS